MTPSPACVLSVVVPVFNESAGLETFHRSLLIELEKLAILFEVMYCDDGSTDDTADQVRRWCKNDPRIKLLRLSRNFGKEIATTAGIHAASGQAIMTLDADGQHPVELMPEFVTRWKAGAKVVIGLRTANQQEGSIKRYGSKLFYWLFNRLTGVELLAGSTDFRLIDRSVQQTFKQMTEHGRITRGLIDWLGYKREYIAFTANPRQAGQASYSFKKLSKLAIDSVISLSISPLYIPAYIGVIVLPVSVLLGLFMVMNIIIGDPWRLHITGGGYVMVLLLFLIGILLVSQGIIGLYLSHIHTETQNRPLYVIDQEGSAGIDVS